MGVKTQFSHKISSLTFQGESKLHSSKPIQGYPRVTFQGESKVHSFTTIQGQLKAHTTILYRCQESIPTQY